MRLLFFASFESFAYMGPGAGLTAFGCLVALLAGIWYTCKGFLWLPLKRKFKQKFASTDSEIAASSAQADSSGEANNCAVTDNSTTAANKPERL